MQKQLKFLASNMAFAGALLISAGFIIAERSPAPQSIGVVLIFLHPFFNGGIRQGLKNLCTNKYAIGMAVYYLLILLSVFQFGNIALYKQLIVMQLPLILIPFGLSDPGTLSGGKRNRIFIVLVSVVIFAGLVSFINYMIHFQEIQEQITHSKPIKIITGINHIYYSVILAFCAGYLQWRLFIVGVAKPAYKAIAWAALLTIVFILHTIAARTGLICFYAEALVSILWLVFKIKKVFAGIGIAAGLGLLAILTITIVPSEKNRLENTRLDLHKYTSGDNINHYSLSMRFEALKTGFEVFEKHPLLGVGPANVPGAMFDEYNKDNSQLIFQNQIKPHNEFLYVLVSMGIIGCAALLFMIFLPVFNGAVSGNYLFLMFIVVCLASFQVEYLLERQVGITFFCLFYIILSQMAGSKEMMPGIPEKVQED